MNIPLVLVDVWSDDFVRTHFDDTPKRRIVMRRCLERKPLVIKMALLYKESGNKLFYITYKNVDSEVKGIAQKLRTAKQLKGRDKVYFAGFHADECIIRAMKKFGSRGILLADYSDTINHFSSDDAEHASLYNKYLEAEFPFGYIKDD